MCDIIPGQLIVGYPRGWAGINLREIAGTRYRESMDDKLERLRLKSRPPFLSTSLHLLDVAPGDENYMTALIYQRFSQLVGAFLVVAPNYVLSVNGSSPTPAATPSAQNFTFSSDYSSYQSMTGLPASPAVNPLRVLVVDTGIAYDHSLNLHSSKNILDPSKSTVDDDNGHGTAVALIINDLAPNHEFIIYKAADSAGTMNEWDLLAALAADSGAHVINLSVEYGLPTRNCSVCGNQSSSSRSTVFETLLNATAIWTNQPIIVAAAGNGQTTQLAYPARFANIVAVGSVNSSKSLAQPSNSGSSDHQGNVHQNHFAAPGGDSNPSNLEHVIQLSSGVQYRGTSFACAFASAAVLASMNSLATTQTSALLSHLRHNADTAFSSYSSPQHGSGVIHV